jgi:hypothetical protein
MFILGLLGLICSRNRVVRKIRKFLTLHILTRSLLILSNANSVLVVPFNSALTDAVTSFMDGVGDQCILTTVKLGYKMSAGPVIFV